MVKLHRWSDADREYLREAAARQADTRLVAKHLNVSVSAVQQQAAKLGVRLPKVRRTAPGVWTDHMLAMSEPDQRLSPELRKEIEAIKREWSSAPRYKLR